MSQLTQGTREEVMEQRGRKCYFCGMTEQEHKEERGRSLDIHHIIPRRSDYGSTDEVENLIPLCMTCHRRIEETQAEAMERLAREDPPKLQEKLENARDRIDELESEIEGYRDAAEFNNEVLDEYRGVVHNLITEYISHKIHIVHITEFSTSRILYAGNDMDKAIKAYQEAENNATLESVKVQTDELIDELSVGNWRRAISGEGAVLAEGIEDQHPDSSVSEAIDKIDWGDDE